MKKKLIFGLVASTLLIIFYWLSTHAYIEVTSDSANGGITYTLLDQGSQKTAELTAAGTKAKKLVRRGSYELLAQQETASYFSVVKTGGFLKTTSVRAKMLPEKDRAFVGNNPAPCMDYIGATLVTFGCGDSYQNLQIHVPATAVQPTYVQKSPGSIEGSIEGVVKLGGKSVVLIKAPGIDEDQGAPHTLYTFSDGLELRNGVALTDLNENETYSLQAYKAGFIVYDAGYERIFYYDSLDAKPSTIAIDKPADTALQPYALSVQGDTIAVAYSNNTEGQVADIDNPDDANVKTAVVVRSGNATRQFTLTGQYASILACGTDKLCALEGNTLKVYDTAGKKLKQLFTVGDVEAIENSSNGLLVIRQEEVLGLDVAAQEGSIQYSLGDYQYCGIADDAPTGYLLCLINSKSEKIALRIDQQQPDAGSIDKKVAGLLKLAEVKDISAYGRFIYVSPELGEVVYDESLGSFGYPPATIAAVSGKINQEIARLGIDRKAYSVINAFE